MPVYANKFSPRTVPINLTMLPRPYVKIWQREKKPERREKNILKQTAKQAKGK